jgi:hypothetical protein
VQVYLVTRRGQPHIDSLGNPNVDIVVSQEQLTDTPAWRIAAMGRTPIGFEGAQEGHIGEGAPRTRLDLTDSTVGDALNAIARADARIFGEWSGRCRSCVR